MWCFFCSENREEGNGTSPLIAADRRIIAAPPLETPGPVGPLALVAACPAVILIPLEILADTITAHLRMVAGTFAAAAVRLVVEKVDTHAAAAGLIFGAFVVAGTAVIFARHEIETVYADADALTLAAKVSRAVFAGNFAGAYPAEGCAEDRVVMADNPAPPAVVGIVQGVNTSPAAADLAVVALVLGS